MVAGIKGTCRMSMILAFKIGFLVCTLSWSSLETIFSFMEMRSVIWGGEAVGLSRSDTLQLVRGHHRVEKPKETGIRSQSRLAGQK